MPKKRLKKISVYVLAVLLVISIITYFFWYQIAFAFQYSRISSLRVPANSSAEQNADAIQLPASLNKIWVHRVNSLQRYDWLQEKFLGFETDLFFNDSTKTFSVFHPPIPPEGDTLSFVSLLSHVDIQSKKFWFDTRNLNANNVQSGVSAFEATGKSAAIKKNCIVEVYDVAVAEALSLAGYRVSLDLDAIWTTRMIASPSYRDSINIALRLVPFVSQQSTQLSQLKEFFPSKKYIIWHLYFKDYFRLSHIQELLDDPKVEVILLNIKSPYFR